MSKVFYQLELSNVLRKQSSCTRSARLPTHNCSSEHGASSSGNAQVRNGHFLVNNFATVKQAWIQISFCVSLNFAGTMSSTIGMFQMDFFFILLHKRENYTPLKCGKGNEIWLYAVCLEPLQASEWKVPISVMWDLPITFFLHTPKHHFEKWMCSFC